MESESPLDHLAEANLLARVADQDAEALGQLYDRTARVLYSVVHSILLDPALSEDVLQEIYLQIWNKAEVYDPALGRPISWCLAIARHKALDRLRSSQRREAAHKRLWENQQAAPAASKPADSGVELQDVAGAAKRAMERLPEKQRQALELAFLHGLPHAEVAESMQQPLGTVKAWIRRGIIELRDQLRHQL